MAIKKNKIKVPTITDLQLVLTNEVKTLVSDINESGIEYLTYATVSKLDKAFDAVVEEANLKHQQHEIDQGEDKGTTVRSYWKDLVRANHPNIYVEKDDD